MCENGFIVLTSSYDGYHPENFPINISMISPFWADADTNPLYGNGSVWYRITTNETIKQRLQVTSIHIFPDSKTFKHLGFSLPPGKTYTIMGVGLGQDAW